MTTHDPAGLLREALHEKADLLQRDDSRDYSHQVVRLSDVHEIIDEALAATGDSGGQLDEREGVIATDAELATADHGGPVSPAALEPLAKGIDAAVTLWLIGGDTDQRYTPNEIAANVHRVIWEQYARLSSKEADHD